MSNKELAIEIYNSLIDMDFGDYEELAGEEIEMLVKEIEILKNNNCNMILNILESRL